MVTNRRKSAEAGKRTFPQWLEEIWVRVKIVLNLECPGCIFHGEMSGMGNVLHLLKPAGHSLIMVIRTSRRRL